MVMRVQPNVNAALRDLRPASIQLKRAYDEADQRDGVRVLVDRLWPRGVSKDSARLDAWMKDLGPSDDLRTWFGHRTDRWTSFREQYLAELRTPRRQRLLHDLEAAARVSTVTVVYGARDTRTNAAVVIRDYLLGKHPRSTRSWEDAGGLLVTLGVVAAAHSDARVPITSLKHFVAAHLTDRSLETALQALQAAGMLRASADEWQLTSRAVERVRQLSDASSPASDADGGS